MCIRDSPMFVWAIRHLDRTFYPVILDVGVGNGRSTILLKETFPQSTITGIDISDTAIAQAKQVEMTNLNFERRDVRETGFSDESVDLITAFQTHFHWRDLEASFMELRRILKSDGIDVYKRQDYYRSLRKAVSLACQRGTDCNHDLLWS